MTFRTDKVEHGYLPFYLQEISAMRGDNNYSPVLVELGVRDGSSMQMWTDLMPKNSVIIGIDNSLLANDSVPGVRFLQADMTDPDLPELIGETIAEELKRLGTVAYGIEMIVDDAGHVGEETATAFDNLWPELVPGGLYVVEDWYVGGPQWPSYDDSMLRFAQQLLTTVLRPDDNVESISYRYGLIALRKRTT